MSAAVLLALVLLSSFALAGLALSGLLALAWHAGLKRLPATSRDLIALRLAPAGGALLLALAAVLPAFLSFEPHQERESAGPWLIALAGLAVVLLASGVRRGWRACRAARSLLARCGTGPQILVDGTAVRFVSAPEPLVAVVGAWRPRVLATESVRAACSEEEFRAVLAHEAAHLAARDNLKLLLLTAAPDPLARTSLAAGLTERWRAAAEREADQRATAGDAQRRVALASALVKLARLLKARAATHPALGMPVAADDVAGRVRALLEPPKPALHAWIVTALGACALLLPLLAVPGYALLHELIERLVVLGR